jgi:hypothetical protein
MLAAGGIYNGTTRELRGFCPMLIIYGYEFWTSMTPLLTPWWQQGVNSVKRMFKKPGALT